MKKYDHDYFLGKNFNKKISDETDPDKIEDTGGMNLQRPSRNKYKDRVYKWTLSDLLDSEDLKFDHNEYLIENYNTEVDLSMSELAKISFQLGCISFGGPLAHQKLLHRKFVKENKFLTEKHFNQILSLCLLLPGYSSSNLVAGICGIKTQSILGGLLSLVCFNLPSLAAIIIITLIMRALSFWVRSQTPTYNPDHKHFDIKDEPFFFLLMILSSGIIEAALALMLQAAYHLSQKLANSSFQFSMLIFSAIFYYFFNNYLYMVILIFACGLVSSIKGDHDYLLAPTNSIENNKVKYSGLPCLILFLILLILFFILDVVLSFPFTFLADAFLRMGAISIGEGHVIIPMILTEFTNRKLIEENEVLNGYAVISMLPGSMFNIASYVGVLCNGIIGGLTAGVAVFLPGFLILFYAIPHMERIKTSHFFQYFIRGANSAAIGFVFTATFRLWVDTCFVNPYTNPIIASLNVLVCYILSEAFKIHKPYVLLFGATTLILQTYGEYFISGK